MQSTEIHITIIIVNEYAVTNNAMCIYQRQSNMLHVIYGIL